MDENEVRIRKRILIEHLDRLISFNGGMIASVQHDEFSNAMKFVKASAVELRAISEILLKLIEDNK